MPEVRTVMGSVDPQSLGTTAMHEHLLFGLPGWEHAPEVDFDRAAAFDKISAELRDFKEAGGATVVDLSGTCLGRDVEFYWHLSKATGVNVVASTGFWAEPGIPGHFWPDRGRDPDYIARILLGELNQGMVMLGMVRTKMLAGIITAGNSPQAITPVEEISIRGAARAAKKTGAAVYTQGVQQARAQLNFLLEEGMDPGRIVIGHCDEAGALDLERDKEIARRGACVAYDNVGSDPGADQKRAQQVKAMVDAGFADRLVLSCGAIGYGLGWPQSKHALSYLPKSFVPMLRSAGVSDNPINTMLVNNPRRLLAY